MEVGEIRRGTALFYAAVIRELDELLFGRRDLKDLLVKDRETRHALRHHVRRVAGIASALVPETLAGTVDDDAALLDRRPRQNAAVRIGHCSVALIGTHVAECGAELLAPKHRFAGAAACPEIPCTADFGTEAGNEIAVTSKTIDREHDFAGNDALPLAIDRLDISTDHAAAAVGQKGACTIADRP